MEERDTVINLVYIDTYLSLLSSVLLKSIENAVNTSIKSKSHKKFWPPAPNEYQKQPNLI